MLFSSVSASDITGLLSESADDDMLVKFNRAADTNDSGSTSSSEADEFIARFDYGGDGQLNPAEQLLAEIAVTAEIWTNW